MISFLVIGAQKCGTTALHNYLNFHSKIVLPKIKETKFFVDKQRYNKGFSLYRQHFPDNINKFSTVGEIDPDIFYFPDSYKRIINTIPARELKFILLLRDPVKRAISHFQMSQRRGIESLSFSKAIRVEEERVSSSFYNKMHFSYLNRGLYGKQLVIFLNYFSKNQLLIISSNELKNSTQSALNKISNYLEIDDFSPPNLTTKFHRAKSPVFPFISKFIGSENKGFLRKAFSSTIKNEFLKFRLKNAILNLLSREMKPFQLSNKDKQFLLNTINIDRQLFLDILPDKFHTIAHDIYHDAW